MDHDGHRLTGPYRPGAPGGRWSSLLPAVGLTLAALVPLVFLAVFFAWPVASIVARGFVTDGSLDLGAFGDVLGRDRTWRMLGLTLAQAVVGHRGRRRPGRAGRVRAVPADVSAAARRSGRW